MYASISPFSSKVAFFNEKLSQLTCVPCFTVARPAFKISSFVILFESCTLSIACPTLLRSSSIFFEVSVTTGSIVLPTDTLSVRVPHISVSVAANVPFTVVDAFVTVKSPLSIVTLILLPSVSASSAIFIISFFVVSFETGKSQIALFIAVFAF